MIRRLAVWLFVAVVLACCSRGEPAPVDPAWGKLACAHCAMLVGDRATAAQALTTDGDRFFFDDVGCLVAWLEEKKPEVRGIWVHQGDAGPWIPAGEARYAGDAHTPMDFGFVATDRAPAMSWGEVRTRVLARLSRGNEGRQR